MEDITINGQVGIHTEKAMAPHSSTLAWKIPWAEEPGRLVHGAEKSRTRLSDFTSRHLIYHRYEDKVNFLT